MQSDNSIEDALSILRNNVCEINTVTEWATEVSYSRAYFSLLIREKYNRTPHQIICREKYLKVRKIIQKNPDQKGIVIAQKAGFSDVKSLYKFLKRHFDTTLTGLRKDFKRGALRANQTN